MEIGIALLIFNLFFYVLLMKTNDALLKFFKVGNVVKAFEDIVLKLLLEAFLVIKLLSQVGNLIGQALLSHAEIVDDQSEVLVHSVEVLKLLSHLVGLLIELLDLDFTGSDVSLELLDLVIEHELELFELLGLFLKVIDTLILVFDCGLTLLDFTLL